MGDDSDYLDIFRIASRNRGGNAPDAWKIFGFLAHAENSEGDTKRSVYIAERPGIYLRKFLFSDIVSLWLSECDTQKESEIASGRTMPWWQRGFQYVPIAISRFFLIKFVKTAGIIKGEK